MRQDGFDDVQLTIRVAHVLRYANCRHLHALSHVRFLVPNLAGRQSLYNTGIAQNSPITLRLREMLQQPHYAMFHLDVCLGLEELC